MTSVLLVCLGNICRSPMAEGYVRHYVNRAGLAHIEVDSAGTGAWHIGNPPDARAVAAAQARGLDISGQRARQISYDDFAHFDIIAAMDQSNYANLKQLQPEDSRARLHLFMEFARELPIAEVPDPYYGGQDGFDHALDLIEQAAKGLADYIATRSRS